MSIERAEQRAARHGKNDGFTGNVSRWYLNESPHRYAYLIGYALTFSQRRGEQFRPYGVRGPLDQMFAPRWPGRWDSGKWMRP